MSIKSRQEEALEKAAMAEAQRKNEEAYAKLREVMKTKATPTLHADHKRPTTRRELVAAGLMAGAACVATPTLLSMISQRAYGQEAEPNCQSGGAVDMANKIPGFLQVNARGGWSSAFTMVPGKNKGGAFEPLTGAAYATNALGASQLPGAVAMVDTQGMHIQPNSQFYIALREVMSDAAFAATGWSYLAQASGDDTGNNALDMTKFAAKVQSLSFSLTPLAGQGLRHQEALADPSLPLAPVESEASLSNLVDPGLLAARLSKDGAIKVAEAAKKLSDSKLKAFNARDLPSQVKELVQCGYIGSGALLSEFTLDRITPFQDEALNVPFGNLTRAQIAQDADNAKAMIMGKLLSEGFASVGSIEMSNYDYHGRGRATQDNMDRALGTAVGIALQTAFLKQAPLFIAITSDGSVSSRGTGGANDRFDFSADSGGRGGIIMIAIDPAGKPEMKKGMVGAFTDSGAVDTNYLVTANSPQLGALGAVYNYAAFAGKMGEFQKQMSAAGLNNPFNENEYLAYAPKA